MKDTTFYQKPTINCGGKLLDLSTPVVMGILNLTPDSFFENSRANSIDLAIQQVEKMFNEGAKIIDLGGQSTRPGSARINSKEETNRILPFVKALVQAFPDQIFSIDTYYTEVAKTCVTEGIHLVNDISSGTLDNKMIPWIIESKTPYIASHFRGEIGITPNQSLYENIVVDVVNDLSKIKNQLELAGHHDLIIDPGFGFGKTLEDNFKLLNQLEQLQLLNTPILVGISRKSMIWKTLKNSPENALNGTSVLNTIALMKGAKILRVHDVKEAVEVIELTQELGK